MGTINLGQARSVADGDVQWFDTTQATDDHVSTTLWDREEDQQALWLEAIGCLRRWKAGRGDLFEEEDAPDREVIDASLDFAFDQMDNRCAAPTSVVPTGLGRIGFEWRINGVVTFIEVMGLVAAQGTVLRDGHIVATYLLNRDPISQRFEMTG